ncbi:SBBP repeat-containing protein, partial [bacterium]|nr:SBBP repeat-containing protein [bacterium]
SRPPQAGCPGKLVLLLIIVLLISTLTLAQNVTISIEPVNPPIEIPSYGGSFEYILTLTNDDTINWAPNVWVTLTTPTGVWEEPIWGMFTAPLHAGQTKLRQPAATELPLRAPAGNYFCTAYVGEYPNAVWDADSIQFEKLEGYEEWIARYDGEMNFTDEAKAIAVDESGNVYVTGFSYTNDTASDFATIKYAPNGDVQWLRIYDSPFPYDDEACSILIDSNDFIYVTGKSKGYNSAYDYATIKYASDGTELWVALYERAFYSSAVPTSSAIDDLGNVYVTGYSYYASNHDYTTVKYNSSGELQWEAHYIGPENTDDFAYAIAVDDSGNIFVTGKSFSYDNGFDYCTIRYNSEGIMEWIASYNGFNDGADCATAIAVDTSGYIYITGYSPAENGADDYLTIKYNSEGAEQWIARYDDSNNVVDQACDIEVDELGNVYVTGMGYGYHQDFTTIKYSSDGVEEWVALHNGPGNWNDAATSLALDNEGNIYVTGSSYLSGNHQNYATVKYNTDGMVQWDLYYNGIGNDEDIPSSVTVSNTGEVYVTGFSFGGFGTVQDYLTIKYTPPLVNGWGRPMETVMGAPLPQESRLLGNYPNPFNPTTTIRYQLPEVSHVKLAVYDLAGRKVATLIDGYRDAGSHDVTFDGSGLASGVYLYRLQASGSENPTYLTGKMVLVK